MRNLPRRLQTSSNARLAAAALSLVASAHIAAAADLPGRLAGPLPTLAEPAAYSWTGIYAGAQVGYAKGHDKVTDVITSTGNLVGLSNQYDTKGAFGGLSAGVDQQYGFLVGGLIVEAEVSDLRGGFNDPIGGGAFFDPGGIGKFQVEGQASVRGRLGVAYDRFLVYGTGGAAFGKLKYHYFNPSNGLGETKSDNRTGWTAGVGVDYALTDHLFIEAEYRRTDFGKFDNVSQIAYPGITGRERSYYDSGRLGVRYKF